MIEFLEALDRWLVLTVNSWNTPFMDEVMWVISGKLTWVPLYLFLTVIGYIKLSFRQFLLYFSCVVVSVGLADLISAELFKDVIERYRPSHNLLLKDQLHFYLESDGHLYDGGKYGFVSSHAANFFALAFGVGLIMREFYPKILKILLIIAVLVCFSRMYLGVHYLTDLIGGALVGSTVSLAIYRFVYLRVYPKKI